MHFCIGKYQSVPRLLARIVVTCIFADDMTTFWRDTVSFSLLINSEEQLRYSGLKMNHEKTEVIPWVIWS